MTSTTTRPGNEDVLRHELDSKRILSECCEEHAACRFQLIHSDFAHPGKFAAFHESGVEIDMPAEEGEAPLHLQAICCVSFPYGTSFCAFLGCLTDVRHSTRAVVTTFPKLLTVTNLRQSFRVPVVEHACLLTTVRTSDDQTFKVVARNITETGLDVEFDPVDHHSLSVGESIAVELTFRGETVRRTAEVRRLVRNRCAIVFARPADDHGQRQAASMHAIVLSLQQLWLKNRLA